MSVHVFPHICATYTHIHLCSFAREPSDNCRGDIAVITGLNIKGLNSDSMKRHVIIFVLRFYDTIDAEFTFRNQQIQIAKLAIMPISFVNCIFHPNSLANYHFNRVSNPGFALLTIQIFFIRTPPPPPTPTLSQTTFSGFFIVLE